MTPPTFPESGSFRNALAFALLVLAVAVSTTNGAAAFETVATISGIAGARDGDDITFGSVPVRLQGIAAPEARAPGGAEAANHLRELVAGRLVVCHLDGTVAGSGGRAAGICYVGDVDVGRQQIEMGFARDCPAYSGGRYADAEAAARVGGKDLSATYELPSYC